MNSYQNRLITIQITLDKCYMMIAIDLVDKTISLKISIYCWQVCYCLSGNNMFLCTTVTDQICNSNDSQIMFVHKIHQFRNPGHCSTLIRYFTDPSCRIKPSQS